MTLTPGTRLGPYEIQSAIGAGGMGEVYKAKDTQLKREVALKVLPVQVATDADRLSRFQREAQLLAALNHPHIAQIHGLAEAEGVRALVMELVEGPTLAERIGRGPLPLDEALPIATQLAEALEYAHERGIIHRDLKPANIKLTPDGAVKVLDFGLAKAFDEGAPTGDASESPTMTSPAMTRAGIILGTAAYMSPEQARGAAVDKRADIWAFGAVLFEMLTGKTCFAGDSVADVIAAVVKTEPDWALLPADLPWRVRDLLHRCLAKDRKQRLHDIADARLEIEAARASASSSATVDARAIVPSRAWRRRLAERCAFLAAGAGIAALVILAPPLVGRRAPQGGPAQFSPLRVSVLHTEGGDVGAPVISPDGRHIAYRGRRSDGMPLIWIRDLDADHPRALEGTEGGWLPFWSPDSRQVGFMCGLKIKRIPLGGGPVQVISEFGGSDGATWAADDTIVFANPSGNLSKVPGAGGEPTPLEAGRNQRLQLYWPSMLPGGRSFLVTARRFETSRESPEQGIYIGSLDAPDVRPLLPDVSSAVYAAPGYIVFARNGQLTAAPFDLGALRITGDAAALGTAVSVDPFYGLAALSATSDGMLAVRHAPGVVLGRVGGSGSGAEQLQWVGRDGKLLQKVGGPLPFSWYMALSPDERRVAVSVTDPQTSIPQLWVIDTASGRPELLSSQGGAAYFPAWSRDGRRIAYSFKQSDKAQTAFVKDLISGDAIPLTDDRDGAGNTGSTQQPISWSHDGAFLIVRGGSPQSLDDLFVWAASDRKMAPFLTSPASEPWGTFSPDGRFVAYTSYETGQAQAYVTSFPDRRQTRPLTSEGAWVRGWREDGREIVVSTLSGRLVGYPVTTEGGFQVTGPPTVLVSGLGSLAMFALPARDHSRFLVRVSPESATDSGEIKLLVGWARALKPGTQPAGR